MTEPPSPRLPRRRLGPEVRRELILEAARGLFAERPYSSISMGDVAEAAGVARSLVHHYFGSLRDIYLEIIRQGAAALAEVRDAGPDLPLQERLERNMTSAFALIGANRETWLAVVGRPLDLPDEQLQAIVDLGVRRRIDRALELNADLIEDTPATRVALRGLNAFVREVTRAWLTGEIAREEALALAIATSRQVLTEVVAKDR